MNAEPLIVCYHTGGPYEAHADRLRASLLALNLPHEIDCVPAMGDWRANAHIRPGYLLEKRTRYPNRPLLSLDADAVVHSDPLPYLKTLTGDIAAHYLVRDGRSPELLPGTLWLRPTPGAGIFLIEWVHQNESRPMRSDRANCRSALDLFVSRSCGPTVNDLPPEYCFISDISRGLYPDADPVIEHFQASRQVRQTEKGA